MASEAEEKGRADFQPQNILVPVDFSSLTPKTLACAQILAQRFGAVVHLVHIAEPIPVVSGVDPVPIPIDNAARLSGLERDLAGLAKQLPPGSRGRAVVREGLAVDGIISLAKELQADLIVMPTHGHTGVARVFFGSVAEGVVRAATCPVFVQRADGRDAGDTSKAAEKPFTLELRTILVPVDFSKPSRKALACAIEFARRFEAKLICLHVLELPPSMEPDLTFTELEVLREGLFAATERTLQGLLKEASGKIPPENVLTTGSASREIIRIAEDRNADLIAMGAHGRDGPGRFLMGSTAERVVRHAHCPVLVVRENKLSERIS